MKYNEAELGSGEIRQSMEHLPWTHEGLSSNLRNQIRKKKQGMEANAYKSGAREAETNRYLGLHKLTRLT